MNQFVISPYSTYVPGSGLSHDVWVYVDAPHLSLVQVKFRNEYHEIVDLEMHFNYN